MLIQLDDVIALKYQQAADRAKVPLGKLLERQLARFASVPVGQRVLVLTGDPLEQMDRLLGLGSTKDPAALLGAVQAWAGITIGDIRLEFSPSQLAEIQHRADKQGKSPEAIVQDIVSQLEQAFFHEPVVAR